MRRLWGWLSELAGDRCHHRSHVLGLQCCWMGKTYDGYCARHNRSCFHRCH